MAAQAEGRISRLRESLVPSEVRSWLFQQQITWFDGRVVEHEMLTQISKSLRRALTPPVKRPLLSVIGPSGVGKSTLLQKLDERVIASEMSSMNSDLSYVLVAGIEPKAPHTGNYDWLTLSRQSDGLHEAEKLMGQNTLSRSLGLRDPRPRNPSRPWRDAYENALRYRHPPVFFVDEAQHLKDDPWPPDNRPNGA